MSSALTIVRTVIVAPEATLGSLTRIMDAPASTVAQQVNDLVRAGVLDLTFSPGKLNFALRPGPVERLLRFADDDVVRGWCRCVMARENPVHDASPVRLRRLVTANSRLARCTALLDTGTWLEEADPDHRLLVDLLERRGLERLLVSAAFRATPPGGRLIRRVVREGVPVRIARRVPAPMLHWPGQGTLHMCRNAVAMRTLGDVSAFVDFSYQSATPHATISELDLVTQLASGVTDETAARHLGISERHYRRRVSAIMTSLGAESRFQAGVEAAQYFEL